MWLPLSLLNFVTATNLVLNSNWWTSWATHLVYQKHTFFAESERNFQFFVLFCRPASFFKRCPHGNDAPDQTENADVWKSPREQGRANAFDVLLNQILFYFTLMCCECVLLKFIVYLSVVCCFAIGNSFVHRNVCRQSHIMNISNIRSVGTNDCVKLKVAEPERWRWPTKSSQYTRLTK